MKKFKNNPDTCKHYPIIGMNADVRHGGCWKILEATMGTITRQCVKCGRIEVSQLASYNTEMFMSDRRRHQLAKDRDENAVNMIQPIDQKTGKFNEEFGKHYGYNPLKTPAPQVNNANNEVNSNPDVENNLKVNKLTSNK